MKLTIITSEEYRLNSPSIFAIIEGNYYGCMIYPQGREFPKVEYWTNSTSSDSDRGFDIKEVNISEDILNSIKKLQAVIKANESMIVRKSYPYISRSAWKIKKGKAYEAWKMATEAQAKEIRAEYELNAPFEKARSVAFRMLRNLLIELKNE